MALTNTSTIRAMIYGFAVGDALGVPYEFKDRGTFSCSSMIGYGTWGQPAGTWSDDTSMMLATMDSLADCKGVDVDDMRAKFKSWAFDAHYCCNGEVFDIGNTTHMALVQGYGMTAANSNGNGSLMRILPLVLVPGVTSEEIDAVSAITHAHATSLKYCRDLIGEAHYIIEHGKLSSAAQALYVRKQEKDIRSTGYVVDTYEAALWCLATSQGYTEAVLKAVNLGGDTDTIAAITGGLAGILWGYDAIPNNWIEVLRNKEEIDRIVAKWPF